MSTKLLDEVNLPKLHELGTDLLATSSRQRNLALLRPFLGLGAFAVAAYLQLWWLTPLVVFLIFIAVVTVTHDVVHGSLGLNRRQTELALFVLGVILLASGHSYRATHLQHHRVFPADDDPEGDPARLTTWQAILFGPLFLPRLWWWSFQRSRSKTSLRLWLLAEAVSFFLFIIGGIVLWEKLPGVLVYAGLVVSGAWVFPLLTVHLPHFHYGATPLTQTHTLRGRIIPTLFLELTYHLEHHLYPQVPSHRLAELSQRLDPVFREAGVIFWYVP